MLNSDAFKIVLDDLLTVQLFTGDCSGNTQSIDFMYGVCAVMEYIAQHVDETRRDEFSTMFVDNMNKCSSLYNNKI